MLFPTTLVGSYPQQAQIEYYDGSRERAAMDYAAIIHERPSGYSFLPELAQCSCTQVSIETAQSSLDCSVLESLTA